MEGQRTGIAYGMCAAVVVAADEKMAGAAAVVGGRCVQRCRGWGQAAARIPAVSMRPQAQMFARRGEGRSLEGPIPMGTRNARPRSQLGDPAGGTEDSQLTYSLSVRTDGLERKNGENSIAVVRRTSSLRSTYVWNQARIGTRRMRRTHASTQILPYSGNQTPHMYGSPSSCGFNSSQA